MSGFVSGGSQLALREQQGGELLFYTSLKEKLYFKLYFCLASTVHTKKWGVGLGLLLQPKVKCSTDYQAHY